MVMPSSSSNAVLPLARLEALLRRHRRRLRLLLVTLLLRLRGRRGGEGKGGEAGTVYTNDLIVSRDSVDL
jgi:hypothetical protein